MSGLRCVLIGPMGVGKSTVGRLVAERLGLPFIDGDAAVVAHDGREIRDIFVDEGEPYFRALERDLTLGLLADQSGVLAVGGGAPMNPDVAAALEGLPVVFLDVGIADAAKRIGFDTARPLLAVNPRASWIRMMNERRETYERLARWRVDTVGREAEDVANEIAGLLSEVGIQ